MHITPACLNNSSFQPVGTPPRGVLTQRRQGHHDAQQRERHRRHQERSFLQGPRCCRKLSEAQPGGGSPLFKLLCKPPQCVLHPRGRRQPPLPGCLQLLLGSPAACGWQALAEEATGGPQALVCRLVAPVEDRAGQQARLGAQRAQFWHAQALFVALSRADWDGRHLDVHQQLSLLHKAGPLARQHLPERQLGALRARAAGSAAGKAFRPHAHPVCSCMDRGGQDRDGQNRGGQVRDRQGCEQLLLELPTIAWQHVKAICTPIQHSAEG